MFKRIDGVLSSDEIRELNKIADEANFVDGRISNPHNVNKQNLHINDQNSYAEIVKNYDGRDELQ